MKDFPKNFCSWEILGAMAGEISSYLGIGVQEGGCVATVVRINPSVDLTLCDTWGLIHGGTGRNGHAHIESLLQKLGHTGQVIFLDGRSQILIPKYGAPVDLSYVDGDHGYDGALADFVNTWPLTKKVMVAHDMITNPTTYHALQEFLKHADGVKAVAYSMDCAIIWRE